MLLQRSHRSPGVRTESRIVPIVTILAVAVVLALLPGRYRVVPPWIVHVCGLLFIGAMIAAQTSPSSASRRLEDFALRALVTLVTAGEIFTLVRLVADMVGHEHTVSAVALLSTATSIWTINVLTFAFLYWELDRGGPHGRAGRGGSVDLAFPRGDDVDHVPADWQPTFPDYLFLAFNTSTAFSPTDTLPLTVRAKMLLMTQSAISLVTVVIVGARAINILG